MPMNRTPPDRIAPPLGARRPAPVLARLLLAITGTVTLAGAPLGGYGFGFAGHPSSGRAVVGYLFGTVDHGIGYNAWAYLGTGAGLSAWALRYPVMAALWLAVALWMRARERHTGRAAASWLTVLATSWSVVLITCLLALGVGRLGTFEASTIGSGLLAGCDVYSPWFAGAAVPLLVAARERDRVVLAAGIGYGVLLTVFLLFATAWSGPDLAKGLLLAAVALSPALIPAAASVRRGWRWPAGSGHRGSRPGSGPVAS
jgi:hypothetical protein